MNLSIELNSEQNSALNSLLEEFNLNKEESDKLDATSYLELVLIGIINDRVKRNFDIAANRLIQASKKLPYEARVALIQEVESKLS